MTLSDLLAQLEKRQQNAKDVIQLIFAGASTAQGQLKRALETAETRTALREVQREAHIIKQVDPEQVRRLCKEGRASDLSRLEQAVVVAQFAAFGPAVIATALQAFPHLRPRFARRLLRDWGVPEREAKWDALVDAGGLSDTDVGIRGLPLEGAALLRADGPARVVATLAAQEADVLLGALTASGLKADGPFVATCLIAWFERGRQAGRSLSRSLRWVLETPPVRSQLVPRRRDTEEKGAANSRHPINFAALVLRAHRERLVDDQGYEAFAAVLTGPHCEFGDPRLDSVHQAWATIKEREPAGYQALIERLNSEDLQFFFDKTMSGATDRREFWLRYLKTIRRTHCVLDKKSVAEIRLSKDVLPERLRQAFQRSGRFKGNDEISAFCLWFDEYVVVEFSKKGNATYVYTLAQFDKWVRPHLQQPWGVSELKESSVAKTWNHNENWERRFRDRLSELGIWAR